MKHITKRVLSLLLTLAMLCGLLCTTTFATNNSTTGTSSETVTIGTGTASNYNLPYGNYYKYSLAEMIYKADEIGTAGEITALAFQVASASSFPSTSIKIYMGHTSQGAFTSTTDWMGASDLTLVYSGSPTLCTTVGWETLTLDTAFEYNGTDNLVIAVSQSNPTYKTGKYFYTSTNDNTVLYRQNDSSTTYPDVSNTIAGTLAGTRPNVQLTMDVCTHANTSQLSHTAATCTEAAYTTYYCNDCGLTFNVPDANSEPLGHNFASFITTVSPTCTTYGYDLYACTRTGCDETEERNIVPALGHNWNENDICTRCGAEKSWDGVSAEIWTHGSGTAADPYLIESTENLAYLAQVVSGTVSKPESIQYQNCLNTYFKLTDDMNLGYHTWTPIGTSSVPFCGTFDGDYHTISGLATTSTSSYQGLFGCVGGTTTAMVGTVKNLIVQGTVTGTSYVGGVAGKANYAAFENVGNEAAVTASTYYAGGIVGYCGSATTITGSYNKGAVQGAGTSYLYGTGGIAGYAANAITLTNCYNLGTVTGSGAVGGLIGTSNYTATNSTVINNSYNGINATVTMSGSTTYYGCIGGYLRTLSGTMYYNTTASSKITGNTLSTATFTSYTSYTTLLSALGSSSFKSGEDINANSAPALLWEVAEPPSTEPTSYTVSFNCDEGVYVEVVSSGTGYQVTNGTDGNPASVTVPSGNSLSIIAHAEAGYEVNTVTAVGVTLTNQGNNSYQVESVTSDGAITVTANLSPTYFPGDGSGTAASPYQIQNETDLRTLAEKVNSGVSYAGIYFKLTADIALVGDWTPIGTGNYASGNAFQGTFDGDNHTVSNMTIELESAAESNGYGLFGLVRGATIKNLAVSGVVTNIQNNTDSGKNSSFGGIVGAAYQGLTLENCASHVEVTNQYYWQSSGVAPESYVGGLVGYSQGGTLTITNCYSDGNVLNKNTSQYYYNDTKNYVGGLLGGFYNYGDTASTIANSFAYNTVSCSSTNWEGAVIGYNGNSDGSVTVTGSYYLQGSVSNSTGATGLSASGFQTLTSTLNTAAGSTLFKDGSQHPIFTWETSTGSDTPTVEANTSWYDEDETEFTLTTEAQLRGLAQLVNEGESFTGKTVSLGNNITLTGAWTPIGDGSHDFSGTFSGEGYTISGLSLEKSITQNYNGLFGSVDSATIEKLIVTGSVVGGNYTAGIVGYAYDSVIRYCGNEASVSGHGYAAGIVGYASGTTISQCYNKGAITNTQTTDAYTGGIVGDLVDNSDNTSTIKSCYNAGAITSVKATDNYCYTGGIAGMAQTSYIMTCYNTGTITSEKPYTGGILGSGNLYYQHESRNFYLVGSASAGAGTGDDSSEYIQSATADDLTDEDSDVLAALGSAFEIPEDGGYPVLTWENGGGYNDSLITAIEDIYDLYEFVDNVRAGNTYEGITVTLVNSIDLEGTYDSATGTHSGTWATIGGMSGGTIDTAFYGTFDGNGKTISNMVILDSSSGYQGLFAILPEGATVKNLTVTGTIALSNGNAGSIVGWNLGTVENCVSSVNITVSNSNYIGGIVGDNAGTVKDCVNSGTVNGGTTSSYVGGIVGRCEPAYNTSGAAATTPVIEDCVNSGDVTGNEYVGGIVGAEFNDDGACASITGSANSGDVTSSGYAGGIVGYMSASDDNYDAIEITDSYNTGDVYGTSDVGGIVGHAGLGELTIENCFSSGAVSGLTGAYVGEIAGYTKATINDTYYVLDTSVTQTSVASGSADNGSRPVSYAYLASDAFEELIGYEYELQEVANANETATFYAYDIYTINVVQTTAPAASALSDDDEDETTNPTEPTEAAVVDGTEVTINRLDNAFSYSLTGFQLKVEDKIVYYSITDAEAALNTGAYPKLVSTEKDEYGAYKQAVFQFGVCSDCTYCHGTGDAGDASESDESDESDESTNDCHNCACLNCSGCTNSANCVTPGDLDADNMTAIVEPKAIQFNVTGVVNEINSERASSLDLSLCTSELTTFTVTTATLNEETGVVSDSAYWYRVNKTIDDGEGTVTSRGVSVEYVTLSNLLAGLGLTVTNGSPKFENLNCQTIAFTPIDWLSDTDGDGEYEDFVRSFSFASGASNYLSVADAILSIKGYQGLYNFGNSEGYNSVIIDGNPSDADMYRRADARNAVRLITGHIYTTSGLRNEENDDAIVSDSVKWITQIDLSFGTTLKLGDVNGDGAVTSADVERINSYIKYVNGESTSTDADDLSKLQFALADVSGNGVVDSEDTGLINSYLRTISAGGGN